MLMRRTGAVAVMVLLVLAACDDGGEKSATPPADRPTATTTSTTSAPSSTTSAPGDPGTPSIQLAPDGLGALPFGTAEAQVRALLTQAFGPPDSDDVLPAGSCSSGATRSVSWGDLHVLFGPDGGGKPTAVGWTYGTDDPPAAPVLATGDGISLGSTLAQLRAAYGAGVEVTEDEALGAVRFSVAGSRYQLSLSGLLTGTADTDTVRALFAGSYCG
ncbi:MAG: hypothetical protein ACRD0O_05030, partial [Acidimicrobiia bacterium]